MQPKVVLNTFQGIDLLGKAVRAECPDWFMVWGPEAIWGDDVRGWHIPSGLYWGIIGTPPCQDFTPMASINRKLGREPKFGNLIPDFERLVNEGQPKWFLMENVERAPIPTVQGYVTTTLLLDNRWLGEEQARRRRFSFGTRDGRQLVVNEYVLLENPIYESAVTSTTGYLLGNGNGYRKRPAAAERQREAARRPIERLAELQGYPGDLLMHAPFTDAGKRKAIANGVPAAMGRAVARAVKQAMGDVT